MQLYAIEFKLCFIIIAVLTHKCQEMPKCVCSPVATDVLVLKHQAISIQSAD